METLDRKNEVVGIAEIYGAFFGIYGDDAWNQLNRLRADARAELVRAIAAKGSTVVECGTFVGNDTALLAAAVGSSGKVYTFDPCPQTAGRRNEALRELRTKQLADIRAFSDALYDGEHSQVIAAFSPDKPGHTVVNHNSEPGARVFGPNCKLAKAPAVSIDSLKGLNSVSLLWIDAQGSAPFVLAGARDLLTRDRPPVIFEYVDASVFGLPSNWPLTIFKTLDYSVYDLSGLQITTENDLRSTKCWNLIAYSNKVEVPKPAAAALAKFRTRLTQPYPGFRGAVDEQPFQNIELVSLRTAARATGELIAEKRLAEPGFDIFTRRPQPNPEVLSVARFPRVGAVAGTVWKPFTPDGLYMEELGYTGKGPPHSVQHWLEFGGRWTIKIPSPLLSVDTKDSRPVFILGGDGAYYHWILNWLPRMMVFDEFASKLGDVAKYRLLLSAGLGRSCLDGLKMLGAQEDNFIKPPFNSTIFVDNAVIPSFFSQNSVSPNVAAWYRRRFGVSAKNRKRRLYITRNDIGLTASPRRRVVNEADIMPLLSEFGFETVRLAEETFASQMALFSESSVVIGPHGAGFANLVFAQPGAKVLVFENSWNHTFMVDMARAIGHSAESILCKDSIDAVFEAQFTKGGIVDPDVVRNRDMLVDIGGLRRMLIELCNR